MKSSGKRAPQCISARSSKRAKVLIEFSTVTDTKTRASDSKPKEESIGKRTSTIHQRRKERKRGERLAKQDVTKEGGRIVCKDEDDSFWEAEEVVGRRVRRGKVEYLIRWKGFPESENSWEPCSNLCDTMMAEAKRFATQQKLLKRQQKEDERRLGLVPVKMEDTYDEVKEEQANSHDSDDERKPSADESLSNEEELLGPCNGEEQIKMRQVVRINVNDDDAGERVKVARENGIPVVLVGHAGWANFAKRWLVQETPSAEGNKEEGLSDGDALLDLSRQPQLDVSQMIKDIGDEDVPVVKLNYDESNPVQGIIKVEKFLQTCWPNTSRATGPKVPKIYLHQWQFPLSKTARWKLCHQNNPLPDGILGEDLLKYWIDESDSVLQYLFMGAEGTMSKLHRDDGGLDILIAPIVGKKECVLVHRSDGGSCLYHLEAKLDSVDLQSYPLMPLAKIWRTAIEPGEILLMPHGTYHQCRNLTPCLSYSRFHLDTVNILAFLQSMINGDAKELAHEEVIWNSTSELIKNVDAFTDKVQHHVKSSDTRANVPLDPSTIKFVKTLRTLRQICCEIARRKNVQITVKGQSSAISAGQDDNTANDMGRAASRNSTTYTFESWDKITKDVDMCLHEFRHRLMPKIPRFRPRRIKDPKSVPLRLNVSDQYPAVIRDSEDEDSTPVVVFGNDLEKQFFNLPNVQAHERDSSLSGDVELNKGDCVTIQLLGKSIKGRIFDIKPEMNAALLSYEEYPEIYDEYQPYDSLRVPVSGEAADEIRPNDVKPGLVVVNRWGSLGEVSAASTYRNDVMIS